MNPNRMDAQLMTKLHRKNARKVKKLLDQGYDVVQVDESVFIGEDDCRRAYSKPK